MAASALLARIPHPTIAEIQEGLAGNLCRCGCYEQITEAVLRGRGGDASDEPALDRHLRPARPAARPGSPARSGTSADIRLPDALARQARHARLRAGPDPLDRHDRRPGACPASRLVMTAADLPQPMPRFGPQFSDRPVLAVGETKYHGDPVAAVAAETLRRRGGGRPPRPGRLRGAAGRLHDRRRARSRRAARPGSGAPARTTRWPATNVLREHRVRLGRRRRGRRADLVVEGTLHVPDGHPLRDRAARVHRRARTATGSPSGARSSTRTGSSGSSPGCWACRWPRSASSRPTRAAASAASSTPSTSRWSRSLALRARPAGPPRPDPRGDVPGGPPGRRPRSASGPASARDGTLAFQDIEADYLIGAYADIADRVVGKGSYIGLRARTASRPPGSSPAASCPTRRRRPRSAASATPRQLGGRVEPGRGGAGARHRPARAPAAQPARPGRGVHPRATRRPTATGTQTVRRAAELIGWGTPAAGGPRPGHRRRHQVGPHDRPLVLHRPAPRRRQRHRLRRHVRHGPGRPDGLRPDRRRGARRPAGLDHGGHGRHRRRALRPADLGQPLDRAHGQRRPAGLPADPGQAPGDGRPAARARRGGDRGRARRRPAARPRDRVSPRC